MEESEVLELDREDLAKTTNGRQGVALIFFQRTILFVSFVLRQEKIVLERSARLNLDLGRGE